MLCCLDIFCVSLKDETLITCAVMSSLNWAALAGRVPGPDRVQLAALDGNVVRPVREHFAPACAGTNLTSKDML